MFSTVAVCIAFMASECYGAFTTVPVGQTAFVGQSVIFQCATNNTSCTIQWYFASLGGGQAMLYNGQEIRVGYSVYHPTPESHNLIINHTTSSDAGSFVCQETCSFVSQQSAPAPLIVFDVESSTNAASQLATDDVVLVLCRFLFYFPTFSAYRPSNMSVAIYDQAENIVANQLYQFISNDWMMSYRNAQTLSANVTVTEPTFGPFRCEVRCLDSTPVVSKRITVLQLQHVSYRVRNVSVSTSNSSVLYVGEVINCSASGFPEPIFYWEYYANNSDWKIVNYGSLQTLRVTGIYILRCTATNAVRNVVYSETSTTCAISVINTPDPSEILNHDNTFQDRLPMGIGIGVAIGVGGVVIVMAAVLVIYCLRRSSSSTSTTNQLYEVPETSSRPSDTFYTSLDNSTTAPSAGHTNSSNTVGNTEHQEGHQFRQPQVNTYEQLTTSQSATGTNGEYAAIGAY